MRQRLKELGLGKLAYRYYYKPIAAPASFEGSRGLIEIPLKLYGEHQLKRRVFQLKPPNFPSVDLEVMFLTGINFYHQTLLCALSLIYAIERVPIITIYDDGTLDQKHTDLLKYLLPNASILSQPTCDEIVQHTLDPARYPHLYQVRAQSIFMRKLMDTNLVTPERIYLDSDMIFWQNPTEMLQLYESKTPFFMNEQYDCKDLGFICDADLIAERIGFKPVDCLNAGVLYLGSEQIDWDWLDAIAGELLQLPMQRFFLFEQTLQAILFTRMAQAVRLPDAYYVAYARLPAAPTTVTHFVASMKIPYMNREWYRWFETCYENPTHR